MTKLTLTILTSSNNPLFTIHHQKISNPQSKIEPAGKPSQGISLCSIQIQWSLSSHWFEIQLYLICCSHFHEKNLGSVHYWSPISKKCIRYLRTDKEVTWHHFAWKTFHTKVIPKVTNCYQVQQMNKIYCICWYTRKREKTTKLEQAKLYSTQEP